MAFKKPVPKIPPPKKVIIGAEPGAAYNWFPGHMLKAMREIKAKLGLVDLVIEIRDARVPLATENKNLSKHMSGKSRLILFNKANLADPKMMSEWEAWFKSEGVPYLFVNCLDRAIVKTVLSTAKKIIEDKRRTCNPDIAPKTDNKLMVIGLPNTGKSTFINLMAHRNATKVADKPGQTRVQLWVKVDEELSLLDTPGIMPPEIENVEHRLWLRAINAIPDEIVGEEDTACYVINHFVKIKSQKFLERYKLESFDLSLDEILMKIAAVRGCLKAKGMADLDRVYKLVLMDFRAGELGLSCFGVPPKE